MTNVEHNKAAGQHRLRADEFAAKAARHEAAAERLRAESSRNPMLHKWPGLARGPEYRERDLAMQARRAEAEARERASYHSQKAAD